MRGQARGGRWAVLGSVASMVLLAACGAGGQAATRPTLPSITVTIAASHDAGPGPSTVGRREYQSGQCVVFDQSTAREQADTQIVPCTTPHVMEVAGKASLATDYPLGAAFPGEDTVDRVVEALCDPIVEGYLGAPLDPEGRFLVYYLRPTSRGWATGDRTAWCGLSSASIGSDGTPSLLTASARGAPQFVPHTAGTCAIDTDRSRDDVPCDQPHQYEFTGTVDLAGHLPATPPPSHDDQDQLLKPGCEAAAAAFLGHPAVEPVAWNRFFITPGSWRAGRRVAECWIAKYDSSNEIVSVSGSLRDA